MSRDKEKDATEDYRALDVRALHRAGVLTPGRSCRWEWKRRGAVVATIGIEAESRDRVRLRYQVTVRGEREAKDYAVLITWTPCHLGGERPWFLCPCCGRRVAKLYAHRIFACRHCLRLNYRSQQQSKSDRCWSQFWAARNSLNRDEDLKLLPARHIPKPKGMHWKTYDKKVAKIERLELSACRSSMVFIQKVERQLGKALALLGADVSPEG